MYILVSETICFDGAALDLRVLFKSTECADKLWNHVHSHHQTAIYKELSCEAVQGHDLVWTKCKFCVCTYGNENLF